MRRTSKGRWVLFSTAAFTTISGFLFDWNRLHLHDPDWSPHARFRAAQSVVSASLLGATGLYFLRRSGDNPKRDLAMGALLPSLFYTVSGRMLPNLHAASGHQR